jgi:hypothetical protein
MMVELLNTRVVLSVFILLLTGCSPTPDDITVCNMFGGLKHTHTARGTSNIAVAYCNDGSVHWQEF